MVCNYAPLLLLLSSCRNDGIIDANWEGGGLKGVWEGGGMEGERKGWLLLLAYHDYIMLVTTSAAFSSFDSKCYFCRALLLFSSYLNCFGSREEELIKVITSKRGKWSRG